ncbi:MAG: hypothetical protein P4L33_07260 [Capsulimonadaceae bacterium]|nr:hypothetical protein [Capsulimonadaceae bacterium]
MRNFRIIATILMIAVLSVGACDWSRAQMVTGERMQGYADAFGVKLDERRYPYEAKVVSSSVPGSVLWPGEQPSIIIQLHNNTSQPVQGAYSVEMIPFATLGIPGDIWKPQVTRLGASVKIPVIVDLPANGHQNIALSPAVPATFGAYAFVVDLGPLGRQFVTSVVRTFKPAGERVQYPRMCLDYMNVDVLKRLGIHAIRYGIEYCPTTSRTFDMWYARQAQTFKALNDANISVLAMIGAGSASEPLGMPRPWLSDDGTMMKTKSDYAWLPSNDADFQAFCRKIASDFGWPKGPVNAFSLWNEPWEGISISGWGADMLRYRELYMCMAHGVDEARQHDGVDVLVGGTDSSSNAFDKLFSDGTDTMLPWFDFLSIHYQGLSSYANVKQWVNRNNPRGRVRIWDTESWVANTDDRVAAVVAGDRAAGYDRAMGVFGGNVQSENTYNVIGDDGKPLKVTSIDAWPVAAAVGAASHFIGERDFNRLLFQNGLPWVMLFDGAKDATGRVNPEDGAVVVVGDLGEAFGADNLPMRTARGFVEIAHKAALRKQLAAASDSDRAKLQTLLDTPETLSGATMTIAAGQGFSLYDCYGNPVPAKDGKIVVPLDGRGFFLRGDGAPGSFQRLVEAVRAARIDGIEPLAIVAHDMTLPVGNHPALKLVLTNVLNRPVTGRLNVRLGALTVTNPDIVSIAAGETRDVSVIVKSGAPAANNTYPLSVRFDAGVDGSAVHSEDMHVNVIAHRSITVDGDLSDWKGVLPQTVTAGSGAPTLAEAAWFPFKKFDTSVKNGLATAYLAYDEKNFYFAAKVADDTPDPGMVRMATRNDEEYFYPAVTYKLNDDTVLQKREKTWADSSNDARAPQSPSDSSVRLTGVWESTVKQFAIDLTLPKDRAHQVALYMLDWDDMGRRTTTISVLDRDTGKALDRRKIDSYKLGDYAVYELSGNVRIVLSANNWLSAPLNALFFDPASSGMGATGTSARFVNLDTATQGNWRGKYGADGYNVIGAPVKYPAYATVATPEVLEKTPLTWPDGVRRYSYRKGPDLPAGDAPRHDNVQIAFNVLSPDQKPWLPTSPGTMPGFINYSDTDYEYALNPIAAQYGGGVEIWRLAAPGMPRKHFYPRQPKSPLDGPVNGQLVIKRDGNTRIVEAAIPWTEIPEVRKKLELGQTIKFTFRVNDNKNPGTMELSRMRSVAKRNPSMHVDWVEHWANEIEFGWEK